MRVRMLSTYWEQLKQDADAQKKKKQQQQHVPLLLVPLSLILSTTSLYQ